MIDDIEGRVRGLLLEGRTLLRAGRNREAMDVFGRVLLQDPAQVEARQGLDAARLAAAETERILEARMDEARDALASGHPDAARALLEGILHEGGDRDDALELLDRADLRGGRLEPSGAPPSQREAKPAPAAAARKTRSRQALVAAWAVVFALLTGGASAHWGRLVSTLSRTPSPTSQPLALSVPVAAPTPGEIAVAEARRLLDQGDAAAAVTVLDRVNPEEPAYPFARQLRIQAESARRHRAERR